jgi:hypothetical protein
MLYFGSTESQDQIEFGKRLFMFRGAGRCFRLRPALPRLVAVALCGILFALWPAFLNAYMPPPDPCEMQPLVYGPPDPPTCAGPPPPPGFPACNPCPPMQVYPRQAVCPPPRSMMVCKYPPVPLKASFKIWPPDAVCPPPCRIPECESYLAVGCRSCPR